jgi:NAD(P)-dependent dehydrogenase (short-subunit alcohol dehydrogenase family)
MPGEDRFTGKVAVITGASSGIGRATAQRLANDGARVFLSGRNEPRLAETVAMLGTSDDRVASLAIDLLERGSAARLAAAALDWAGEVDMLVNCAGSFPSAPANALEDSEWDHAIELNLSVPMRLARGLISSLERRNGVIVLVSSINAFIGDGETPCAHYAAAKAGLCGLARQLAVELAPSIRVVGVAPGGVDTPMLEGWNDDPVDMDTWLERYVPLRRLARPEEIADAIAFLSSDSAAYITGHVLMIDGGMAVV